MFRRLERTLWLAAALLIAGGLLTGTAGAIRQAVRLAQFDAAISRPAATIELPGDLRLAPPDVSDWSDNRTLRYEQVRAWHVEGLPKMYSGPAAVLRIPEVGVAAEIFGDTSEASLSLGIGHIEGTAAPGERGNIGLAGHRDGFFRRLKDIRPGQSVHLITTGGRWRYEVEDTRIVSPSAVEVLAPSDGSVLTLVTCYPFYFLGPAPARFVVRARLIPEPAALGI